MDDNGKLFDLNKYGKEIERPLNIVYNDKRVDINVKELFDSSKFDTAYIVTYSSSYSYLVKLLEGFEHVFLVVGCEDSMQEIIGNRVAEIIDNTLFKDKNFAEKVLNNVIKIRYPPPSYTIHSKIYVLTNESGATRVMFGSANLTPQALSGKHQIEELEVYDSDYNAEKCNEKLNRVKEIWDFCIDYKLSKEAEKVVKDKIDKGLIRAKNVEADRIENGIIIADVVNANEIINSEILNPEERAILLKEQIVRDSAIGITPEERMRQFEERRNYISTLLSVQVEEAKIQEEFTKEAMRNVKNKKYGDINNVPVKVLAKQISEIIQENQIPLGEAEEEKNFDVMLQYDSATDSVLITKRDDPTGEIYPEEYDTTIIRDQLLRLNLYMESYRLFLQQPDKAKEVQRKIFEVILYGFMSPFVWKIRNEIFMQHQSESEVARIPPIMIVSGDANAGKTKLIEVLYRMIGGSIYMSYMELLEAMRAGTNKKNLANIFKMKTVSLFLVDEVTNIFDGVGENFIKDVANKYYMKPHPCMIGTTNARYEISKPDILKRIYYIHLPTVMRKDPDSVREENEYLTHTVNITKFDNTLHKYFVHKVLDHIAEGDVPLYDINDPLFIGRHVFKEMYEYVGLPEPDFIPDTRVDDVDENSRRLWNDLYTSAKDIPGAITFDESEEDGKQEQIIIFNFLRIISNLQSTKQLAEIVEDYKNKLPDDIIANVALKQGLIRLKRKPFFAWIRKKDNFEKKQLSIKDIFSRIFS